MATGCVLRGNREVPAVRRHEEGLHADGCVRHLQVQRSRLLGLSRYGAGTRALEALPGVPWQREMPFLRRHGLVPQVRQGQVHQLPSQRRVVCDVRRNGESGEDLITGQPSRPTKK